MLKSIIVVIGLIVLTATLFISASQSQNINGVNNTTTNLTQNLTSENLVQPAPANATLDKIDNLGNNTTNEKLMDGLSESAIESIEDSTANGSTNASINVATIVNTNITTNITASSINGETVTPVETRPQSKIVQVRAGVAQKKIFMLGKTWESQPFEIMQKIKPLIDVRKQVFVSDKF
ncbi:MAG: hypothetical protein MUO26_07425 [Methanotrichaceae archaeon]|nr:hypothetical protein [Methanotrichaceae archaeon]